MVIAVRPALEGTRMPEGIIGRSFMSWRDDSKTPTHVKINAALEHFFRKYGIVADVVMLNTDEPPPKEGEVATPIVYTPIVRRHEIRIGPL